MKINKEVYKHQYQKKFISLSKRLQLSEREQREFSKITRGGEKLSSKQRLLRISKIEKEIKTGKLLRGKGENRYISFKKYIARSQSYQEVKQFLPTSPSIKQQLGSLSRTDFYYQNRELIIKHNKYGGKYSDELKLKAEQYKRSKRRRQSQESIKLLKQKEQEKNNE